MGGSGGGALASAGRVVSELGVKQCSAARTNPQLLHRRHALGDILEPLHLVRRDLGRCITHQPDCALEHTVDAEQSYPQRPVSTPACQRAPAHRPRPRLQQVLPRTRSPRANSCNTPASTAAANATVACRSGRTSSLAYFAAAKHQINGRQRTCNKSGTGRKLPLPTAVASEQGAITHLPSEQTRGMGRRRQVSGHLLEIAWPGPRLAAHAIPARQRHRLRERVDHDAALTRL